MTEPDKGRENVKTRPDKGDQTGRLWFVSAPPRNTRRTPNCSVQHEFPRKGCIQLRVCRSDQRQETGWVLPTHTSGWLVLAVSAFFLGGVKVAIPVSSRPMECLQVIQRVSCFQALIRRGAPGGGLICPCTCWMLCE